MTAESEEFASGGPFDFGKDGWANSPNFQCGWIWGH